MYPTPRKGDGSMDASAAETPSSEQRKRGRPRNATGAMSELLTPLTSMGSATAPSPSPARRRGCNCKKSGCLKLYCECFAAGVRCGDRCQCLGCKNREHNKMEIAHAMETIEKRSQRSFKSPIAVARKLGTLRASTPQAHTPLHTPGNSHHRTDHGLSTPVMDGATRLLMSAERIEETPWLANQRPGSGCICAVGACHASCPCHENFGGCGRKCACQSHIPTTQEKNPEKGRGCSCKKSNCLKLYCECLAAQRMCDSRCNCAGCKNHPDHTHERERAIAAILERNPMAFEPKVASGAAQHQRGCNCRKSNCMKNYCECHQAGVPCTGRCACQDCRNTDAFVSAKKMLIFSGDLKVRGRNTSPDGHHSHSLTPSSAKPPRRPSRRASLDQTSPPSQFRTPTTDSSGALAMLSRTAPPAAQQDSYSFMAGQHGRVQSHAKRKQDDDGEDGYDLSSEGKRKSAKSLTSRPNFQERLERAASQGSVHLPSVESVLGAELDVSQPDLPLSKLCRSLLNAAGSVDMSPTPRKIERSPAAVRGTTAGHASDEMSDVEQEGPASPMTDDLLCEEDIETPTRGTPGNANGRGEGASASKRSAEMEDKQRVSDVRLAALQERAVLQEFSVWLRNLATSAAPLRPPQ